MVRRSLQYPANFRTERHVPRHSDQVIETRINHFSWCLLKSNVSEDIHFSRDGIPSVRAVLLKSYGTEGFKFYSNYESRKGRELVSAIDLQFTLPPIDIILKSFSGRKPECSCDFLLGTSETRGESRFIKIA